MTRNMQALIKAIAEYPVIAAVKPNENIVRAIKSRSNIIFLLGGSILELGKEISGVREAGKIVFVHFDLIEGLGRDNTAIDYIVRYFKPHGIITTRNNYIRHARDCGLITVQRTFLLDSKSIESGIDMAIKGNPDMLELMPGVIPKAISDIRGKVSQPVIAGGMITTVIEMEQALQAGACAISTSNAELWNMGLT